MKRNDFNFLSAERLGSVRSGYDGGGGYNFLLLVSMMIVMMVVVVLFLLSTQSCSSCKSQYKWQFVCMLLNGYVSEAPN